MPLPQAAGQDTTHSMQAQLMLDKLEQHLEHDREPATHRTDDIARTSHLKN